MLDFSVTFIITIINIAVLFFVLRLVLFKPVTKFMADRAKQVQDSIDQAEMDKTQAQELLVQYQDKLKNADAEAAQIIKIARNNAETEARHIFAEGKTTAEALTAAARQQIELEQQAAYAQFRLKAAALVMMAASRLVQREISGDDNRRYANMLLNEFAVQSGLTSQTYLTSQTSQVGT
jgi:F-type H+-transporting ATPase subunit b